MARHVSWMAVLLVQLTAFAQGPPGESSATVLEPARVFDGEVTHVGWAVRVQGDRIRAVGRTASVAAPGATVVKLPGMTLLPGLVEGHSHVLLHPYNETSWDDQVLHESLGVRTARAVNHLRATLMADDSRSGNGRRQLRRCRVEAGGGTGNHSRAAHAGEHARDRRNRQLRTERILARMACAARRRGSRRRRAHSRRPRSDWPWR